MNRVYIFLTALIFANCTPKKEVRVIDPIVYRAEIDKWHAERVESLKGKTGWLNLVGLFWLKDGINTFGSGIKNDIVFPEAKIPESAGFFMLKQNTVTMEVSPGVNITSNGSTAKSFLVFHPDSAKAPREQYESLEWFVIKRDNKYGVRLRDFTSTGLQEFKGIERYAVDAAWRLEAKFEKADSLRTIDITNILGQTTAQKSPGTLVFMIGDKEYRLDVLNENAEEYFVIVGDATNAKETYGAGRYLSVAKPNAEGITIIDFNKAYNPPCAFTSFATCPLPPKQNILSVEITAGEKNYGHHAAM